MNDVEVWLLNEAAKNPKYHTYKRYSLRVQVIKVEHLIQHRGDIHHIFPKNYLKKHGLTRGKYNQLANYVYMQSEINIKVGNKPPKGYMSEMKEQIDNEDVSYGSINNVEELQNNLRTCAIPLNI